MSIPDNILKLIDDKIYQFLWQNKKSKIAKCTLESQISEGGLKMPNIKLKVKAWKLTWLKRAVNNPTLKYIHVIDSLLGDIQFIDLIKCRLTTKSDILQCLPPFYKDIIEEWIKIRRIN